MNRREFIVRTIGIAGVVLAMKPRLALGDEAKNNGYLHFEPITIDRKLLKELKIEEFVDTIDDKIRKNDLFGTRDPDDEFYKLLGTIDIDTAQELMKQRQYEEILKRYTNPVEAMIRYDMKKIKKDSSVTFKTSHIYNVFALGEQGKARVYYNNSISDAERVKLLKSAELWLVRALSVREEEAFYINLGCLYARSFCNYEKGIPYFDKALAINPNSIMAKILKRKALSKELECEKVSEIFH